VKDVSQNTNTEHQIGSTNTHSSFTDVRYATL